MTEAEKKKYFNDKTEIVLERAKHLEKIGRWIVGLPEDLHIDLTHTMRYISKEIDFFEYSQNDWKIILFCLVRDLAYCEIDEAHTPENITTKKIGEKMLEMAASIKKHNKLIK